MRRLLLIIAAVVAIFLGLASPAGAGVGDYQRPPNPNDGISYLLGGNDTHLHPFGTNGTGDVWIEAHFELTYWDQPVNGGLPWYAYVAHTRWDQQVGPLRLHYGACQSGKACVKMWDGYLGPTNPGHSVYQYISTVFGYSDGDSGYQYPYYAAVTLNNNVYSPSGSLGTDTGRAMVMCRVLGEAFGMRYDRPYQPNTGCMTSPQPSGTVNNIWPMAADITYGTNMYNY